MKKNVLIPVLMAAFAFLAFSGAAMAKQDIPQIDGTYNVPGHPDMQVRVFVHKAKLNFGKAVKEELPACTDPGSTAAVKSAGWKLPKGDWNYYINYESIEPIVGNIDLKNLTEASFAEWKEGTDLTTNFVNQGATSKTSYALDQANIITWGTASNNALAVTYTWYNRKTRVAVENDTIMNKAFQWSWTPYSDGSCGISGTYDAQNILTHELGHWVGLNDHYIAAYANNTMYGYGSKGEIKKDTLTNGDISGVNKIY